MTEEQIKNATLEAIYWWNRDEYYYHRYFSKIKEIYKDKALLEFFTCKVFEVFLREYAIRRNLSAGYEKVNEFIGELFDNNFINEVIEGNVSIVDEVCKKIKIKGNSSKRQTKSLLSKVAFLINPNAFALLDSRAKVSIWTIYKSKKLFKQNQLEDYAVFMRQIQMLKSEIESKNLFKISYDLLNQFKGSPAHDFFTANPVAFEMRIVDKFLWIYSQGPNDRKVQNSEYLKFYNLD